MNSVHKRIVFDTSSLIPVCLHPDREPARGFRHAILNYEVFSSPAAIQELFAVLSRPKFDAWRPLAQRLTWARLYREAATIIEPSEKVSDCRDEKGNKFLELALAAKADFIVSSDIHLLEVNSYRGIAIIGLQKLQDKPA